MFEVKEISIRKVCISVLALILLNSCTELFARQRDFGEIDGLGKLFGKPVLEAAAGNLKEVGLCMPGDSLSVIDLPDTWSRVQESKHHILFCIPAVEKNDYDFYVWVCGLLGLHDPYPQKSYTRGVSISSGLDELMDTDIKHLDFENTRLIEAISASQKARQSEIPLPLMDLVWQIGENIDFAIVGRHQLEMAYPDFVDYLKAEDREQAKSALYAKLTLRF
jgi:hypothetical protein